MGWLQARLYALTRGRVLPRWFGGALVVLLGDRKLPLIALEPVGV